MDMAEDDDDIPPAADGEFQIILSEEELYALLRGEGAAGLPPVSDPPAARRPSWLRRLWKRKN